MSDPKQGLAVIGVPGCFQRYRRLRHQAISVPFLSPGQSTGPREERRPVTHVMATNQTAACAVIQPQPTSLV